MIRIDANAVELALLLELSKSSSRHRGFPERYADFGGGGHF